MKTIYLLTTLCMFVTVANAQLIISKKSDVKGRTVTGEWKKGTVVLKDGTEKDGETKAFVTQGDNVKSMKFRAKKGEKAVVYKPDATQYITWDGVIIASLPKKFKKPKKGNRFYAALYYGKNISVLFDPEANTAGVASLNSGEKLSVLVLKDNVITKINKLSFKGKMRKICGDSKEWMEKAKDKKWFKYKKFYEVASYYDDNK